MPEGEFKSSGADAETPEGEGFNIGSVIDRARQNLNSPDPGEGEGEGEGESRRPRKYTTSKQKEEISQFIGTILALFLAAWTVPDDLKPNRDETDALAGVTTRLLLRHVDLSGKLTQDALDLIGIIAIISGYYARTASGWKVYRDEQKARKLAETPKPEPEPKAPEAAPGILVDLGTPRRPGYGANAAS